MSEKPPRKEGDERVSRESQEITPQDIEMASETLRMETGASEAAVKRSAEEAQEVLARLQEAAPEIKPVEAAPEKEAPATVAQSRSFGATVRIGIKRLFGKELTPEENRYRFEELRGKFDKTLQSGDINDAFKTYVDMDTTAWRAGMSEEERVPYRNALKEIELRAVREGRAGDFKKILKNLDRYGLGRGMGFTRTELGLSEGQEIDPKIRDVARESFLNDLRSVTKAGNVRVSNWYANRAATLEEAGLSSREELSNDPVVRKILKEDIIDTAKRMYAKDSWVADPDSKFREFLGNIEREAGIPSDEVMSWKQVKKIVEA